jgi:hypothetical protein
MAKKKSEVKTDAQESEVAKVISDDEYQRRIKLDVSNPEYINPSYDR